VEDPPASLTVTVTVLPTNGTLNVTTGAAPLSVTYTPNANYNGPDSFQFRVRDTLLANSNPVTVNITVTPVNDQPVALSPGAQTTNEDTAKAMVLTGTDVEDPASSLTVDITLLPANGTLSDTAARAAGGDLHAERELQRSG